MQLFFLKIIPSSFKKIFFKRVSKLYGKHNSHLYGFSLLWVLECVFKLHTTLNEAEYTFLEWFFKCPNCANEAEQTSHLNGFSPLWILECFSQRSCLGKQRQMYCTLVWSFFSVNSRIIFSNLLYPNIIHTWMVSPRC